MYTIKDLSEDLGCGLVLCGIAFGVIYTLKQVQTNDSNDAATDEDDFEVTLMPRQEIALRTTTWLCRMSLLGFVCVQLMESGVSKSRLYVACIFLLLSLRVQRTHKRSLNDDHVLVSHPRLRFWRCRQKL